MKKLLLALFMTMSATAQAGLIGFDDGFTTQTGTLTYDGLGGGAVATDILFDSILGTDTPSNSGSVLECRSCTMDFITGANITEGLPTWSFGAGGSISILGEAWDGATLIASGVLASGSFISTPTVLGLGTTSALFAGFGLDEKNADLIDFFGYPADTTWTYATTSISLGTCSGGGGTFDCGVSNADFNNISNEVPEPTPLALMGLGLMGLVAARKKRV